MMAEAPLLQTRLGCVVLTILLCLGIGLRLANLSIATGRSPDETNYTAQAMTLLKDGSAGLKAIADEYQQNPAARLAGPPTRAGYLWLLATTMRLTGHADVSAGAVLSCAASIGSLFLLTLIGIRFFPPWATLFALLSFVVSPAEMELARRAWIDSLVGFLGLALIYVSCEITSNSKRRIWHCLFVLIGALGIVVKEFGPVVFALCTIWVLWVMIVQRRDFRNGFALTASVLVATAVSIAWIAHSIGGASVLVQTVGNWLGAHRANDYAIEYQSGPGYLLFRAFEIISPFPALCCAIGLLVALLSQRYYSWFRIPDDSCEWHVVRWIVIFTIGFLVFPMILPHWLNLRYVSVLFGPFYLLAGLGFWVVADALWNRLGLVPRNIFATTITLAIATSAYSDFRRFDRMFVNNGLGDLSVRLILDRADMTVAEKRAKSSPTAENYLNLCNLYDRNWRYIDAIGACQKAIQLKPTFLEAYSSLTTAYMDLELWEEAIETAEQALRINPQFPFMQEKLKRSIHEMGLRD